MLDFIRNYWQKINPNYRGIVLFVIVLFASNYFWEFSVYGDEIENTVSVTFFGVDVSPLFGWAVLWFSYATHILLGFWEIPHILVNNMIGFCNGNSMYVVSGCTAIKQFFIAFCIIAFSRGSLKHKLWYTPCVLVLLVGFNVLRLTILSVVVRNYVDLFNLFHAHIMKYMFYAFILVLWYIWDEYLRLKLL